MALGSVFAMRPPEGRRPLHRLFPAGGMAPVSQPSMEFEPLFRAWAPLQGKGQSVTHWENKFFRLKTTKGYKTSSITSQLKINS